MGGQSSPERFWRRLKETPTRRLEELGERSAQLRISRSIYALPMASVALSKQVGNVVGCPPLSEMSERQRREFHEALLARK